MSAPHEPRWFQERPSRRKLIRGRKISSRMKRKDPRTNPRDLLANENAQFHEPEYIKDIGYHLQQDIISLREDVRTLHRKVALYTSAAESDGKTPVERICSYDPSTDVAWGLSAKLRELEAQKQALKQDLHRLSMFFEEGTEERLNADIVNDKAAIHDEEQAMLRVRDTLSEKMAELRAVMQGSRRGRFGNQATRIEELTELLNEMKKEEEELMAVHEQLFKDKPRDDEGLAELARLRRKHDLLIRTKQRRELDIVKLKKNMALQKQGVKDSVKVRKLQEKRVKENTEWNNNFRVQQQELREERREKRKRQKEEILEQARKAKEELSKPIRKPKREDVEEQNSPNRRKHRRKRRHPRTETVEHEEDVKEVQFQEEEDVVTFTFGNPMPSTEGHEEDGGDELDNDMKDLTERIRSAIHDQNCLKIGQERRLDEFGLTESMAEQSESCVSPRQGYSYQGKDVRSNDYLKQEKGGEVDSDLSETTTETSKDQGQNLTDG